MQFVKGAYTHPDNSVAFTAVQRTFVRGQTGRQHILRISWGIRGKIVKATQSEIWGELNTLKARYAKDGESAGFPGTPFWLDSPSSLGGVCVTNPISHGPVEGAEGITYLNWTAGLEADYAWAAANDVLEFQETLSFSDNFGLPIYVERIPAVGLPILQQVTTSSWFFCQQTGRLVQPGQNPNPMPPIFPQQIRTMGGSGRSITYGSPKMIRGVPISYDVQWRYDFVSAFPLFGQPNPLG